jgi:hypothetical protein
MSKVTDIFQTHPQKTAALKRNPKKTAEEAKRNDFIRRIKSIELAHSLPNHAFAFPHNTHW